MSSQNNINQLLDDDFKNHNYLPQKLGLEDFDRGITELLKSLNFHVTDENNLERAVPLIFTSAELWAERKVNWKSFRNEYGEEITKPFMALGRTAVKTGTSPLKYTVPNKKKFTWLKVPYFDGSLTNYVYYKIPQPAWTNIEYELVFISHYVSDVNAFLENIIQAYSGRQKYMKINGYNIRSIIEDPSQTKQEEIDSENLYTITVPITVFGKLVDPTQFEKVYGINKMVINVSEKKV